MQVRTDLLGIAMQGVKRLFFRANEIAFDGGFQVNRRNLGGTETQAKQETEWPSPLLLASSDRRRTWSSGHLYPSYDGRQSS